MYRKIGFFALASVGMLNADVSFQYKANLAQYGGADYANAIRVERGISLEEAFQIAEEEGDVAYFVYLKGGCMVLPVQQVVDDPLGLITRNRYMNDDGSAGEGHCRIFHHGDTVFFKDMDQMWLGSAPGLADTYVVKRNSD